MFLHMANCYIHIIYHVLSVVFSSCFFSNLLGKNIGESFDGDVDARGLRAEALHLVKSGKPIVANDYPLAQAA
jgi:hypothetical protein